MMPQYVTSGVTKVCFNDTSEWCLITSINMPVISRLLFLMYVPMHCYPLSCTPPRYDISTRIHHTRHIPFIYGQTQSYVTVCFSSWQAVYPNRANIAWRTCCFDRGIQGRRFVVFLSHVIYTSTSDICDGWPDVEFISIEKPDVTS